MEIKDNKIWHEIFTKTFLVVQSLQILLKQDMPIFCRYLYATSVDLDVVSVNKVKYYFFSFL